MMEQRANDLAAKCKDHRDRLTRRGYKGDPRIADVLRLLQEIEDFMTGAGTWFSTLKGKFDAAVAGDAPPTAPTIGQVILSSGKPAVIGLDADDVASADALGADAAIGTLTAAVVPPAVP